MKRPLKLRIMGVLLGITMLFTACGDDLSISIPIGESGTGGRETAAESGAGADVSAGVDAGSGADADDPVKKPLIKPTDEPSAGSGTELPAGTGTDPVAETSAGAGVDSTTGTPTDSATEQPAEPEEITITISAAGDVTMGNYREQGYDATFRQTYDKVEDKSWFFENVADIFAADDMTIVNLEGVLTLSEDYAPGRTYNIKGDPEYAYLLTGASIEAVSMANNHRLDYGEAGSKDTVAALEDAGVAYAYERNLGTYEVKGIKIGWVSVNEVTQGQGVEKFLEEGIAKLKEDGADLILACCHWGTEREYYPEEYQKTLGRKCIDWGADLVIGHHPHVLQGIEQYEGKYIVYSLGNFCFGANRNPSDKDTMIFQQTFTFREGEPVPEKNEARIIPCRVSSVTTRNDFKPTPLSDEEGQRVIDRVNEFSKDFGVTADSDGVLTVTPVSESEG